MNITLSTPEEIIFIGPADRIALRTTEGEIAILPGHIQYMAEIGKGQLIIDSGESTQSTVTTGGIIYNCKDAVSIVLF